jgi:hypothetical protein
MSGLYLHFHTNSKIFISVIHPVHVDIWTRNLEVTTETRPSVGAVSFQCAWPLDSLTNLEQYMYTDAKKWKVR